MSTAPARPSLLERWGSRGALIIAALAAVVVLLAGFLIGWLGRGSDAGSGANAQVSVTPASDSVEAGFARDMIAHHRQAVLMANMANRHTEDAEIETITYDLAATQLTQIGHMQGWLQLWQLPEQVTGPRMVWMGHTASDHTESGHAGHGSAQPSSGAGSDAHGGHTSGTAVINTADDSGHMALMPGMATSGEMEKLKSLRGAESDAYYLQLMLRHHQGGESMMQYAADHAKNPVVATFAGKMLQTQSDESKVMIQMLKKRGLEPLPFEG